MSELSLGLLLVLLLVLAAEFVNGWTDAPNAIAKVVSTRALKPGAAILMASALNFLGAMSGTAVAATIGKDIVRAEAINLTTVGAAQRHTHHQHCDYGSRRGQTTVSCAVGSCQGGGSGVDTDLPCLRRNRLAGGRRYANVAVFRPKWPQCSL